MDKMFLEVQEGFKKYVYENSFVTANDVCAMLTISRTTLYDGMDKGIYPKPYQISKNRVGWAMSEILEIINKIKENGRVQ